MMPASIKLIQTIETFKQPDALTQLTEETQNADYEGYTFTNQDTTYRSRLAKLTPKKKGYFVAFWEKDALDQNQAYSYETSPKKTLIVIIDGNKKGLFAFPKEILLQQHILKTETQKGKMAIRVYPSWESDLNPTATKTQKWQSLYFTDLSDNVSH